MSKLEPLPGLGPIKAKLPPVKMAPMPVVTKEARKIDQGGNNSHFSCYGADKNKVNQQPEASQWSFPSEELL